MHSDQIQKKIDLAQAAHNAATKAHATAKTALDAAVQRRDDSLAAQATVQAVAAAVQTRAKDAISRVVTRCLAAVFPVPYEFDVIMETKRGQTEARLVFMRDGQQYSPVDSAGGGVVDVAAFALRLACLLLSRPQRRRLVLLDEPFKFVSADYRPAVRQLLDELASEMDMQFIIVTHIEELITGKTVYVK